MIFYRFRSTKALLDRHQELSKQSIYFAHPESLNDPMEGYREIYWRGDEIAWKNLFRHYTLCLERVCMLSMLCNEGEHIDINEIPVFMSISDFPTDEAREYCLSIAEALLKNEHVDALIKGIASRTTPIRKNELTFYLSAIHLFAIELIQQKYEEIKIIPSRQKKIESADEIIKTIANTKQIELIESLIKDRKDKDIPEIIFSVSKKINLQLSLLSQYNTPPHEIDPNKTLIIQDFPESYVKSLAKLIYPDWYTACFMSSCESSSVWGHYGDNHKGVCLIFESIDSESDNHLQLIGVNGWSSTGPTHGPINLKFEKINYADGFGEIDFFRSLGRLTATTIRSTWHTYNGEISSCSEGFASDEDWRNHYWDTFYRDLKIKSKDWEYEKEYRLILNDMLNSHTTTESRTLTYDIASLKGIIFGINTSTEDKLIIMRIIGEKLQSLTNPHDFKFYQAYYSPEHKCIKHTELTLIKYNQRSQSVQDVTP
jgi:hypothetical protein